MSNQKLTVLIIDDTPMIVSTLSRMLLSLYNVKVAKDGTKGIELAEGNPIDLILLDIKMPGLSGFDVLDRLKASNKTKEIPVIFITSSDELEDEARGLALGAADYIKKPFEEADVLHRVGLHIIHKDEMGSPK